MPDSHGIVNVWEISWLFLIVFVYLYGMRITSYNWFKQFQQNKFREQKTTLFLLIKVSFLNGRWYLCLRLELKSYETNKNALKFTKTNAVINTNSLSSWATCMSATHIRNQSYSNLCTLNSWSVHDRGRTNKFGISPPPSSAQFNRWNRNVPAHRNKAIHFT